MKLAMRLGFGVSGLGLIAWPMFVFASIFIFDAPFRSGIDAFVRYSAALATFVYPVVWGIALKFARRTTLRYDHAKPLAMWIATPYAWIIVIALLMFAWDYCARHGI